MLLPKYHGLKPLPIRLLIVVYASKHTSLHYVINRMTSSNDLLKKL